MIEDDSYCQFCGCEEDGLHAERPFGMICDTCCDNICREYSEHRRDHYLVGYTDGALKFDEWLKLAYPDRVIVMDWPLDEQQRYTQIAASMGMTLEELVADAIKAALETYRTESE